MPDGNNVLRGRRQGDELRVQGLLARRARRQLAIQSVWVLIQLRHTKAVKNCICRFPTSRRRMGTALDGERWTSKPSSPTCHAVYARCLGIESLESV